MAIVPIVKDRLTYIKINYVVSHCAIEFIRCLFRKISKLLCGNDIARFEKNK